MFCFFLNCTKRLIWLIHLTDVTDWWSKLYDRHRRIHRILVRYNPSQNTKMKRKGNLSPVLSHWASSHTLPATKGMQSMFRTALGRGPRGGPRTAAAHSRCSVNTCRLYGAAFLLHCPSPQGSHGLKRHRNSQTRSFNQAWLSSHLGHGRTFPAGLLGPLYSSPPVSSLPLVPPQFQAYQNLDWNTTGYSGSPACWL